MRTSASSGKWPAFATQVLPCRSNADVALCLISMNIELAIDEFRLKRPAIDQFRRVVEGLVQTLTESKAHLHSVVSRTKTEEHLREKLQRPGKAYSSVWDVKDIVGIRVITYFNDDVDIVANIIAQEFQIDPKHSVDNKSLEDPTKFGYASLHHVCTLHSKRAALAEYAVLGDFSCEIQIRSILQHTWAEIEHDLGYKSKIGVPSHLRRRFAKLSALLELGDDEFLRLRNDLEAYQKEVENQLVVAPNTVAIDNVSLRTVIETEPIIERIDQALAAKFSLPLGLPEKNLDNLALRLSTVKVETVEQLLQKLEKFKKQILRLNEFAEPGRPSMINRGASVYALSGIMLGDRPENEIVDILTRHGLTGDLTKGAKMLRELFAAAEPR
jgi:putative GTP pyrophosphokinase